MAENPIRFILPGKDKDGKFIPAPFAEQVAFFRGKLGNLVPTNTWRDIMRSAHDTAFMVAGAAKADLLADLAAAVDKAIHDGEGLQKFRQRFGEIVQKHGWQGWTGSESKAGTAWRTRVIYRTNMATSYAAGRLAQLQHFPLWIYKHSGAEHPRLQHKAWDGLTLPADHEFWKTHYPPNGWGCGCRVVGASSEKGAARLGGKPGYTAPPDGWDAPDARGRLPGIDEGWDYMPGGTAQLDRALDSKVRMLPAPIGGALSAEGRIYTDPIRAAVQAIERAVDGEYDKTLEYAALIRDGNMAWIKRGGSGAVHFTSGEVAQFRGAILVHNHPNSMSLSREDLILAMQGQLKRIYAIGKDGSIYAARITAESINDLLSGHERADTAAYELLMSWIRQGRITAGEANTFHWHIVNAALSKMGHIRYHAILPVHTPDWVWEAINHVAG